MPVKNPRILPHSLQTGFSNPLDHDSPRAEPEIRTVSRTLFEQQRLGSGFKGAGHKRPQGTPLMARILRPPVRQRQSTAEKSSSLADELAVHDPEESFPYRVAAKSTLDSMLQDDSVQNREQITEALANIHEPLQQYTILFGALKQIDNRADISPSKRLTLKNAFNEMMTDLVNRDRAGIRKGLREGAESSPVAARIDAALANRGVSAGLRDLRFKIGARAKGGIDEELTAMVMIKALLKNAGAAYAEEAMESVCARLMPGLRTFSTIKEAAYALTMSDAVAFSIARTAFKIARDLKRDMADKAAILCKLHYVEAAVVLLMAAELGWGKGRAIQLVNQLVDLKDAAPRAKARVIASIRKATDTLPVLSWSPEKLSGRTDLLEDLDRQELNAYAEIPLLTTKAERKEEEWRNAYAAGRAPTLIENR